jgi:hypothetical protein
VTGGGFEEPEIARSSIRGDIPDVCANHEEADTRIILHAQEAIANGFDRLLIECRDTDVIILLIHFLGHLRADIWMVGGTAKQRKFYPITQIATLTINNQEHTWLPCSYWL